MNLSKAVSETIAALRAERVPLAARLDAIDLAIENPEPRLSSSRQTAARAAAGTSSAGEAWR